MREENGFPAATLTRERIMTFDLSIFADKSVPLPELFPSEQQAGLDFGNNTRLPDPMDLIRENALVVVSLSGGKDGQAMLIHMVERLKIPTQQMVCIHADLDKSEWEGTADHARSSAERYGIPFLICRAQDKQGNNKDLLDYVDQRGQFFDRSRRYCTSDWKRGPIRRTINAYRSEIGHSSPYVLNCMGMRAQESTEREKLDPVVFRRDASCPAKPFPEILDEDTRGRKRIFFDWHPILHFSEEQVFATIAAGGQEPHWAYTKAGARRLSCLICMFSNEQDIRAAVKHSEKGRDYARRIIEIEDKHDHTILPLRSAGKGKPKEKRWIRDIVQDLI